MTRKLYTTRKIFNLGDVPEDSQDDWEQALWAIVDAEGGCEHVEFKVGSNYGWLPAEHHSHVLEISYWLVANGAKCGETVLIETRAS